LTFRPNELVVIEMMIKVRAFLTQNQIKGKKGSN